MTDSSEEYDEVPAAHLTRNKADGQSPGEMLREARLAHDYSIEDLCAQTKLSAKTVQALEDNDFKALSQPVFARGYYRQCAKVLDVDSDRLMAAYAAWGGESAPQPASPTAVDVVPEDVTPGGWRSFGLIGGLLLLLVAIGVVFMLMPGVDMPDENRAGDSDNVILSDADDAPMPASAQDGAQPTDDMRTPDIAGTQPEPGSTDSGNASPAAEQARTGGRNVNDTLGFNASRDNGGAAPSSQSEPAAPAVDPNHLALNFTGRSWVDVRDANGKRLLTGIYESGEKHEFDGTPPYKITLGYAPGVDVSIGGEAVDVAAETTGNSTARLTVAARDN